MPDHIFKPIVSAMTAIGLEPHRAGWKVDFVVHDQRGPGIESVVVQHRAYRFTAQVHVTLWLSQPDFTTGNADFTDFGIEPFLVPELAAEPARKLIGKPKPGIVQSTRIAVLGIPETHNHCKVLAHYRP